MLPWLSWNDIEMVNMLLHLDREYEDTLQLDSRETNVFQDVICNGIEF